MEEGYNRERCEYNDCEYTNVGASALTMSVNSIHIIVDSAVIFQRTWQPITQPYKELSEA